MGKPIVGHLYLIHSPCWHRTRVGVTGVSQSVGPTLVAFVNNFDSFLSSSSIQSNLWTTIPTVATNVTKAIGSFPQSPFLVIVSTLVDFINEWRCLPVVNMRKHLITKNPGRKTVKAMDGLSIPIERHFLYRLNWQAILSSPYASRPLRLARNGPNRDSRVTSLLTLQVLCNAVSAHEKSRKIVGKVVFILDYLG